MTDTEKVQDQQQQLKQKLQNHSDGVNGESTPDSVIQPKQIVGEYGIRYTTEIIYAYIHRASEIH